MSEHKLVSPLLDGFLMGDPISDHDGVRCCPAMRENSEDKYIVKIISVPSSQRQLDALLLTGAYPDAASAMDYFREQAEGIVKEAEVLKQLSKLQGFLPYENTQIVPMDNNNLGYEVYLLSPYRRSLEKYMKGHTMTHLGAVNLGLDLCSALSICRRAGYLFVDLKPSNIFITGSREYRIGDLGFIGLDSLKFSSLPSKYRSAYTPRELHDDLSTLNPTADIYAVGMILYQIYNNGNLPFETVAPAESLPSALNADYEMAEIIQKAIDPNPRKRWQTPIEMGQALVSYMQRNKINDTPIVPPAAGSELSHAHSEQENAHEEVQFVDTMTADETVPDALSGDDLVEGRMSEEVSSMLAQADELLDAELPELVVVPKMPELNISDPEEAEEPVAEEAAPIPEMKPKSKETPADESDKSDHTAADSEDEDFLVVEKPKAKKKQIVTAVLVLIVAALLFGGIRFYNDYYLLPIDGMQISGSEDTISVFLRTDVDEALLNVICTDTYGNTRTAPVVDGLAEFIGLNPGTMYKISVQAQGFHGLSGVEPCSYTTSDQTKIVDFTAKTGTEDGSVVLSFTVAGRDTQDWMIEYSAEEEETKSISFTGHMVTVTGLTVGKRYTFSLIAPAEELWIVGNPTIEYIASKIVVAEDLAITGCVDGVLTAQWSAPEDTAVDSWIVRCYSDAGYDQTITTSGNSAEFKDILSDKAYTVEVTAVGMTQNIRTYVSANPATITRLDVEAPSDEQVLNISWEYEGTAPEGGWLLLYTINGNENHAVITCSEPSAVIASRIPGVTYELTIQASDGSTVFGGHTSYVSLDTDPFEGYGIEAKDVSASLCPTPEKEDWTYKDIDADDYTSKYYPGDDASLVIYTSERPDGSGDAVDVMFVIRDENGGVLTDLTAAVESTWNQLWSNRSRYCTLDIPSIPKIPGKYSVEIYFNNRLLVTKNLTILETES